MQFTSWLILLTTMLGHTPQTLFLESEVHGELEREAFLQIVRVIVLNGISFNCSCFFFSDEI